MATVKKGQKASKTKSVKSTASFSFDSAALVKKLLAAAPERSRKVLMQRFGLGTSAERETLEDLFVRKAMASAPPPR